MFSTEIVSSDQFLDMGQGAQLLYFQLGMRADDDGFVNPRSVMRMLGINEDELKVLLAKRFILPFESGVVVIKHWLIHNLIRSDLYKETQYKKEKNTLGLNQNGAYTELFDANGDVRIDVASIKKIEAPKWLKIRRNDERTANVPQTARRIGKERLGKVSKVNKALRLSSSYEEQFESFWETYPEKVGKGKAYEVWLLLTPELKTTCVTAITNQVTNRHFFKDWLNKDSVPHPTTWLNQRRWEDIVKPRKGPIGKNALVDDHTDEIIANAKSKTVDLS